MKKLVEFYDGDYFTATTRGVDEVSYLFPHAGISGFHPFDNEFRMDVYPGNPNLYDFVVNSAHTKDIMIYG